MAAPPLYWQSYLFEDPSFVDVGEVKFMTMQLMQQIGLANAAVHKYDVNGSSADTFVAVCYVTLGAHKWIAIVMAAGAHAKNLRDQLIKKFETVVTG